MPWSRGSDQIRLDLKPDLLTVGSHGLGVLQPIYTKEVKEAKAIKGLHVELGTVALFCRER